MLVGAELDKVRGCTEDGTEFASGTHETCALVDVEVVGGRRRLRVEDGVCDVHSG